MTLQQRIFRLLAETVQSQRHLMQMVLMPSVIATLDYLAARGKLLGVGICDVAAQSLSSVYFYFDPAVAGRGMGTFSALFEIEWARQNAIPYWYGGYYVAGCGSMEYKAAFGPYQLLGTDGQWRPSKENGPVPASTKL